MFFLHGGGQEMRRADGDWTRRVVMMLLFMPCCNDSTS